MQSVAFVAVSMIAGGGDAHFDVQLVGASTESGHIQSIATNGTITIAGGKSIAVGDWYSVRRPGVALPRWPRAAHLEFVNGDRVVGSVLTGDGDFVRLRVQYAGGREQVLRFPVSALRVVWFTARPEGDDPPWLTATRSRDAIRSKNGDLATGAIIGIDPGTNALLFQSGGKDQQTALNKVAAIAFNPELARVRRPKGPYYRLTLADGSRLSVMGASFDGETWTAQTMFKESLKVPANQVISVDSEQGRVVYLADLKPSRYQYSSFDAEHHDWVANRSVTGRPLRLNAAEGDSTFDRGIGLHAECTIRYALAGKFRLFEAVAGLDANSGRRGDAIIEVVVDGKARDLPNAGHLTAATGAAAIRIDVAGAKELTIAIRRGKGGNVQDHVNLAEARLVP